MRRPGDSGAAEEVFESFLHPRPPALLLLVDVEDEIFGIVADPGSGGFVEIPVEQFLGAGVVEGAVRGKVPGRMIVPPFVAFPRELGPHADEAEELRLGVIQILRTVMRGRTQSKRSLVPRGFGMSGRAAIAKVSSVTLGTKTIRMGPVSVGSIGVETMERASSFSSDSISSGLPWR